VHNLVQSYDGLESDYAYKVVDHAQEYVNGNVHTNRMDNFCSPAEAFDQRHVCESRAVPLVVRHLHSVLL
jgi:hypothetical protein